MHKIIKNSTGTTDAKLGKWLFCGEAASMWGCEARRLHADKHTPSYDTSMTGL